MPYVKVWVDCDDLTDDQWKSIRRLVLAARDVAFDLFPDERVCELGNAAEDVARTVLINVEQIPKWPADKKYKEWLRERDVAKNAEM